MRLEPARGRGEIFALGFYLQARGLQTPGNMDPISADELQPSAGNAPNEPLLRTSRAAVRSADAFSALPAPILPARSVYTKAVLIQAIKAHSAKFQRPGQPIMRSTRKLHRPRYFWEIGQARKIRLRRVDALYPRISDRYVHDAASASMIKQVRDSLPSMASAFRRYAAFCELRRPPPFRLWGELFSIGSLFGGKPLHTGIISRILR